MNTVLLIITITTIFGIWQIVKFFQRKEAKEAQDKIDRNIERILMSEFYEATGNIELFAKYSRTDLIASYIAGKVVDLMKFGIHPQELAKLFSNLGLYTSTKNNWSDKELELSALIQQYILRHVDSHTLEVYQMVVCQDKKQGFSKLNNSFLAKAEKNMLIWSPSLS